MMAKAAGVLLALGAADLEAHRLAPHPVRTFKLSKDPAFGARIISSRRKYTPRSCRRD